MKPVISPKLLHKQAVVGVSVLHSFDFIIKI